MCPFVGRDGAHQVGTIGRAAEDGTEGLLVLFNRCDLRHNGVQVWVAHLNGIDNWQRGLLLERVHPAVPELRLIIEGVQNGRCVALADAAFDADGGGLPFGEGESRIMACAARDGAINRQAPVEKKSLTQGNFLRSLWIVRWDRCTSHLNGRANLLTRPRLG